MWSIVKKYYTNAILKIYIFMNATTVKLTNVNSNF